MERLEIENLITEARELKQKSMEFSSKVMEYSINPDSLKYMNENDIWAVKETINLIDDLDRFFDTVIRAEERMLNEQRDMKNKIDEIYRMMKTK